MDINSATSAPIFILCCDRSGSSLLRYIVDTHPDIASPAELNLGEVCQNLYYLLKGTLGEVSKVNDLEKKNLLISEVRQIVSGIMTNYISAKNKKIWCEKSPRNLLFLKIIKEVFPDAKYICLHRHAMDVVYSCLEASRLSLMPEQLNYVCQNSGSIVGAMVQNWVEKNRQILEFEQEHKAQCYQIKYESYVLNPVETLQPMFEFLGVTWDNSLLDSVFCVPHDLGPEDPKVAYSNQIRKDSIGKGAQVDTLRIPPHLMKEMNQLLTTLNYPVVDKDWGIGSYSYLSSHISQDSSLKSMNSSINAGEMLINSFSSRLNDLIEALENNQVVYKIIVIGNHGGIWSLDLADPDDPIKTVDEQADCTLTFFAEDAIQIVNNTLNPIELWMQGKLQVSGDRRFAEVFCWFLVDRLQWRKPSSGWWWGQDKLI